MEFIAKTLHGLEPVLLRELQTLGAGNAQAIKRGATFDGDLGMLYRAHYELRTAIRILRPIYRFQARSERQLYHRIHSYNWAMHFTERQTFAISSNVHSHHFRHSQYVALKMKDAIVDQFRKKTGQRPSVDTNQPDCWLNIHVSGEECTVSLDGTGESLHRRGYRDTGHAAPLNEVLAAGMLGLADWSPGMPLLDPMCGTGTILLEAAMQATRTPAGFHRKGGYTFMNWKDYDADLFRRIKAEADAGIRKDYRGIIQGGDTNPAAVRMAKDTLYELGFGFAHIRRIPFKRHAAPAERGWLITNPPYGERLGIRDIGAFYKEIGDTLKQNFQGWTAWVISSNMDALKHVGLRPAKKQVLFNGPLECKFQRYELYGGSRKVRKSAPSPSDNPGGDDVGAV